MNPTKNPMRQTDIINPLRHKYYSIIRDMYHPFLYDNFIYCEMSDERLIQMLNERDIYVKTIQINVMDALLTDQERDWVHFLRNCCSFEVHRRRYKLVLNDMMAYVRRHQDSHLSIDYEITPYFKVWQWLRRYLDSPRYELDQEDLEYRKINNQPVISFEHPVRHINEEIQRRSIMQFQAHSSHQEVDCQVLFQRVGPAPSEPTDDYYAAFESAEGSVATSAEEMGNINELHRVQQKSGTPPAAGKYVNVMPAEKDDLTSTIVKKGQTVFKIPKNFGKDRATQKDYEETSAAPEKTEIARSTTENDVAAAAVPQEEVHLIPQNDEPAALSLDTERNSPNVPAASPRREIILYDDYPRDFFYAHPELFEIHTVESLGKLMSDREYIKQRETRKEELKEMARKREIALAEYYAEKAKESNSPQETVSDSDSAVTVTIDDDDLTQSTSSSTSQMGLPYDNDPQLPSTSYYSNDTQVRSVSDYHLGLELASASYCSNVTVMPSTSNDSQIPSTSYQNDDLAVPLKSGYDKNLPSTSYYNNNDDDTSKGAIRKQYYNKNKVSGRDEIPPPVPDFFPSSKGSVTMDSSDFRELESDNTYHLWYLKETGQMTENGSDDPPAEHSELPKIDLAGSEAEIDCTLPPIEPDFTNLPLPEIPEDN